MKKSTQRILYTILVMVIVAAGIIYAFFNMTSKTDEEVPKTKIEKLISRNLEGNYPATPREVVKVYGELTKYLYNGDEKGKLTEEQLEALFDQIRLLYSEELLAENPREEQLGRLKADIEDYKKKSKTIMSYSVEKTSQIETGKLKNENAAEVLITFTTKASGEQPARTHERVLLREEEEGCYKIVGWEQISGEGIEE